MSDIQQKKKKKKKKKKTKEMKENTTTVPPVAAETQSTVKKDKKKKTKKKKTKKNKKEQTKTKKTKNTKKEKKKLKKETKESTDNAKQKLKLSKKEKKAKKAEKAKTKKNTSSKRKKDVIPVPPTKRAKTAFALHAYEEHPTLTAVTDEEIARIRKEKLVTVSNCDLKPVQTFQQTGLSARELKYVERFSTPTPIQSESWPPLLCGRDCIGIAQTGSGKTLGFGLPAIRLLMYRNNESKQRPILMLTLSPTRELAQQTDKVLSEVFAPINVKTVCIFGGGDKRLQIRAIRSGAQVVTATPGRLLAMLREGSVHLDQVEYLVLDEADRMLDLGFEPDIRAIVGFITRPQRQTLLFSATWPKSIQKLASEFVNNPVHITVGNVDSLTSNKNVTQIVEVVEQHHRQNLLLGLLKKYHASKDNRVLVFVLYKKEVGQVERFLKRKGFSCSGISSDYRQHEREKAIADFKSGSIPLLIATDVAARGLDIKNVEYVINYSFPLTVEDYIHRIGRTGRGGAKGLAHTFFTSENKSLSGELVNVLTDAGAEVPDALRAFGCFTKRKQHSMYGAFAGRNDGKPMKKRTRVTF